MPKQRGKVRDRARKKEKNKSKNDFFLRRKNLLVQIRKFNDPILEAECDEVISDDKVLVEETFKKMIQILTMTKNGVGLAASQIGVTKKLAIIRPDSKSHKITCMINPEIIAESDKMKYGKEGCLSYPDTYAFVERYTSVTVRYLDEEWKEHEVKYDEGDILGIIIQHELEHLDAGHCQIHDWWENPEMMEKILRKKLAPEGKSSNEVVESEDLKKEKEESDSNNSE